MAKLLLTPENQIQRLNQLLNAVENLKERSLIELTHRPHEKSWNVLEVLEHLCISYALYEEKIQKSLNQLGVESEEPWEYRPGFWNRFVLEGQRPKGKKRAFKMKTLKKFEPQLPKAVTPQDAETVFEKFKESHIQLKKFILASRNRQMNHQRIPSAIGPIIKFHLPEAFEFLICHMERHKVQIDEIVSSTT
ncbi:MAG: hypothetical protein AAGC45_04415 [Bacteroidota bacterium]